MSSLERAWVVRSPRCPPPLARLAAETDPETAEAAAGTAGWAQRPVRGYPGPPPQSRPGTTRRAAALQARDPNRDERAAAARSEACGPGLLEWLSGGQRQKRPAALSPLISAAMLGSWDVWCRTHLTMCAEQSRGILPAGLACWWRSPLTRSPKCA